MTSQFYKKEVEHDSAGFLLRVSHKAEIKAMATLASSREDQGRMHFCDHADC